MYTKVLLTNDGSDLAAASARQAAVLARALDAEVLVMRVSHAAGEPPQELTSATWERQIALGGAEEPGVARAEAYPPLSDTTEALVAAGVSWVGSLVVRGEPGEAIVEAASRLDADLIVMSTHGLTGIRRAVLGSVADHVVRNSPGLPVMLCRPLPDGAPAGYRRLLVALDGSELSEALLPHARELAARTEAEVVLVRVVDSAADIVAMTTPAGYPLPAGFRIDTVDEVVRDQRATAEEQLSASADLLRAAGLTSVTSHIAEGDPASEIVAAAEELQCDLVLLATHGRGGLGRVLLGSVTDRVTRDLTSAAALVVPATQPGGRSASR